MQYENSGMSDQYLADEVTGTGGGSKALLYSNLATSIVSAGVSSWTAWKLPSGSKWTTDKKIAIGQALLSWAAVAGAASVLVTGCRNAEGGGRGSRA